MDGRHRAVSSEPSETQYRENGTLMREIWALPLEEAFLEAFLRDLFEQHWPGIRLGPMIEGAAWEWKCPGAPKRIGLFDGYLTVMFGNGGHFHLCIGENRGSPANPTDPALRAHIAGPRGPRYSGASTGTASRSPGASNCGTAKEKTASRCSSRTPSSTTTTRSPIPRSSAGWRHGEPLRAAGSAAHSGSTRRRKAWASARTRPMTSLTEKAVVSRR